jgi:polyisoprenoid-binding protein YceI
MNRIMRILATAAFCLITSSAMAASTWTIAPDHSNVQFRVRHMMIGDMVFIHLEIEMIQDQGAR